MTTEVERVHSIAETSAFKKEHYYGHSYTYRLGALMIFIVSNHIGPLWYIARVGDRYVSHSEIISMLH